MNVYIGEEQMKASGSYAASRKHTNHKHGASRRLTNYISISIIVIRVEMGGTRKPGIIPMQVFVFHLLDFGVVPSGRR